MLNISLSNKEYIESEKTLAFRIHNFKNALRFLGPGLITGASDDDPSGIATYSQAGAGFGLGMLWLAIFSISVDYRYSRNVCRDWIGYG